MFWTSAALADRLAEAVYDSVEFLREPAMSQEESVTLWLRQLAQGDDQAAQLLWERYFDELVRVARRKLAMASRRVADEEDVALVAFNSFCNGVQAGRFSRLDDRDDLWQILLMLTARKAIDQRRHDEAEVRGAGAVRGESVFSPVGQRGNGITSIEQVVGEAPTPEFALAVSEEMESLLLRLDNDELQLRDISLAKLEGKTNAEIAQCFNMSLRSVERKLSLIRRIWRDA